MTGVVSSGKIQVGDDVEILGLKKNSYRSTVTSLDAFDKVMTYAEAGESVRMFLKGMALHDLTRGQCVIKPRSLKNCRQFEAETYVLTTEEGGKGTTFTNNYKPQVISLILCFVVFCKICRCGSVSNNGK